MRYIPLDEIEDLLEKYSYSVVCDLGLKKDIKSLKTIDLSIIDEMIDEVKKSKDPKMLFARAGLEELKERLSLNK